MEKIIDLGDFKWKVPNVLKCPYSKDIICYPLAKEVEHRLSVEHELKEVGHEKREYEKAFNSLFSTISKLLEPTNAAFNLFIERISQILDVEEVYVFMAEDAIDIWTITKKRNFDAEEKIIEAECEIMRIFRDIDFDFMILPREGRNLKEILPSNGKRIYPSSE